MTENDSEQMFTLERLVRDVAEVLYLDPDEIAVDENVLDQGLDSIRLMTLVETWRADGAQISFVDLAERPTLTEWTGLLAPGGAPRADA
ncbi:phosphopantetheine-binding protein [Streptomyces sp. SID8352]|uniref:phosphopantetheine-binding protein n=1 Tax=Streptomyces sp. SID8352 TaxID=2690338 RepID=UPI001368D0B0|nr:phosphopantetheine-binding protein [Streptomyces sp. SID8352]MYU23191.1 phosphopantetheine attachment domain protein [Streptomyces sp. SID8352]